MSAEEVKAAAVTPPLDAGSNEFGVLKFTAGVAATETSHAANVVPAAWRGQYVEITVLGGTVGTDRMHYGFSESSTAEVDRAVAATQAGVSAKVGGVIPTGETRHVRLPGNPSSVTAANPLYFVRESTATGLVAYIRLASGKM